MEDIMKQLPVLATDFGLKIIAALAVFIFGRWAAKLIRNVFRKVVSQKELDATLMSFLDNVIYYAILTFVVFAALGQLGVETTSTIAVFGAAGLAIGFALQGSLSNFAAGFLIIIFRPIRVGDFIDGAGESGIVEKIQIFTTQLRTPDNKTVIIPNAQLTDGNIVNYTVKGQRRIDFVFGVSYTDDIDKVKRIIREVVEGDDRVLKDPPVQIGLIELGDSSVNFAVRPWVDAAEYWNVYFDINEQMKKRFDAEGISIPFPQRDIHLYNENNTNT